MCDFVRDSSRQTGALVGIPTKNLSQDQIPSSSTTAGVPGRNSARKTTGGKRIRKMGVEDIDKLPVAPVFEDAIGCKHCAYSTKTRSNLERHLHLHLQGKQPGENSTVFRRFQFNRSDSSGICSYSKTENVC